jgi:uncharacterized protein
MTMIDRDHEDDVVRSDAGSGATIGEVVERRVSRRAFLKSAVAGGALVIGAQGLGGTASAQQAEPQQQMRLAFAKIAPSAEDRLIVAEGHSLDVLIRWGDPITADAPEFDINNLSAEAQAKQFGYNNDFVGYFPIPSNTLSNIGILAVNHEYTNPELMFAGYDPEATPPTKEQVDVELAAHGVTIVQVALVDGRWTVDRNGPLNRRYTATSPMRVSGPAAGHEWLKTSADPSGTEVLGTLNNCAGGKTPWGTMLTAEENFHQYFANASLLPVDDPRVAFHDRYGVPDEASERRWELYYDRFDVAKEPNEPFRHGWVVEIDPYDPSFVPVKRTALGRFRHEGATFAVSPSGRVAFYTGDDAVFEYMYKFVTNGAWNPSDKAANLGLLDDGVLYVARLNEDGSGEWLPLVFGQGPLTPENGFNNQAEVLINTRLAADLLGATKMDRPEDIEANPITGKVYALMTNNSQRGAEGRPGVDAANPRPSNRTGHVIELTEANNDHAATSFSWELFLLAGDPADESTYFAGFDKALVSPIACPDNLTFDAAGNLWIATDGAFSPLKTNDGLFAVPTEGAERGYVQQFLSTVRGSEVCAPEFAPDGQSLFITIQHPGEGGTFAEPASTWPDGGVPRPALIVARRTGGGMVGLASEPAQVAPQATMADGALALFSGFLSRQFRAHQAE